MPVQISSLAEKYRLFVEIFSTYKVLFDVSILKIFAIFNGVQVPPPVAHVVFAVKAPKEHVPVTDSIKVFTEKGFIITRQTIASVEAMLSESQFIRIHRSYIVSLNKLKSFTAETVEIGNKELPVGKLYRNNFLKLQGN